MTRKREPKKADGNHGAGKENAVAGKSGAISVTLTNTGWKTETPSIALKIKHDGKTFFRESAEPIIRPLKDEPGKFLIFPDPDGHPGEAVRFDPKVGKGRIAMKDRIEWCDPQSVLESSYDYNAHLSELQESFERIKLKFPEELREDLWFAMVESFDAGFLFCNAAKHSHKPHIPQEEPPLKSTRLVSEKERALWPVFYRECWQELHRQEHYRRITVQEVLAKTKQMILLKQSIIIGERTIWEELKGQGVDLRDPLKK